MGRVLRGRITENSENQPPKLGIKKTSKISKCNKALEKNNSRAAEIVSPILQKRNALTDKTNSLLKSVEFGKSPLKSCSEYTNTLDSKEENPYKKHYLPSLRLSSKRSLSASAIPSESPPKQIKSHVKKFAEVINNLHKSKPRNEESKILKSPSPLSTSPKKCYSTRRLSREAELKENLIDESKDCKGKIETKSEAKSLQPVPARRSSMRRESFESAACTKSSLGCPENPYKKVYSPILNLDDKMGKCIINQTPKSAESVITSERLRRSSAESNPMRESRLTGNPVSEKPPDSKSQTSQTHGRRVILQSPSLKTLTAQNEKAAHIKKVKSQSGRLNKKKGSVENVAESNDVRLSNTLAVPEIKKADIIAPLKSRRVLSERRQNAVKPDGKFLEAQPAGIPSELGSTQKKIKHIKSLKKGKTNQFNKGKEASKCVETPLSITRTEDTENMPRTNKISGTDNSIEVISKDGVSLTECKVCEKSNKSCVCDKHKNTLNSKVECGKPRVGADKKELPLGTGPVQSCSHLGGTQFKTPATPKPTSAKRMSLGSANKASSIFSLFKKPETPRRNSGENKIFVSSILSRSISESHDSNITKDHRPVYENTAMTPLKRSTLPSEQKMGLYEFEVDENEPKPKKKHRRIMKIQRVRVNRKKPKAYVLDRETEMRVLRNLDLSPSILLEFDSKKTPVGSTTPLQSTSSKNPLPSTSTELAPSTPYESLPSTSKQSVGSTVVFRSEVPEGDKQAPSSDAGICDIDTDYDHHDFDNDACPTSPCSNYESVTPAHSLSKSRDSLLDESYDRFGVPSTKFYSPAKSKNSPIPILLANYNNDPARTCSSDKRSSVSNVSVMSSAYINDLDISASTPIKHHMNVSTPSARQDLSQLNVENCFGFDEPDLFEEPLVSPIKSTIHVSPKPLTSRAAVTVKRKPALKIPTQPAEAVDVSQVIKQLRFEVGESTTGEVSRNLSVYDDTEISPRKRSPMKRYLLAEQAACEKSGTESFLETITEPAKIPRLSYERPKRRKRQEEQRSFVYVEPEAASESDSEEENDLVEEPPKASRKAKTIPKKVKDQKKKEKEPPRKREKGMTKKEEEELEKWAQQFNSQCDQVDNFGLCVERN